MAAVQKSMPRRGDRLAPTFDGTTSKLNRFIEDVELLGADANVGGSDLIKWAVRYCEQDVADLWSSLPTHSGADWAAFKVEVEALYPGVSGDRKYSIQDMERLTATFGHRGIATSGDLGEYHREFVKITRYLISKGRLSEHEQNRAYIRGFSGQLRQRLDQRLMTVLPQHFPDDPYNMDDVRENAAFLLTGTAMTPTPRDSLSVSVTTNVSTMDPLQIKREEVNMFIACRCFARRDPICRAAGVTECRQEPSQLNEKVYLENIKLNKSQKAKTKIGY